MPPFFARISTIKGQQQQDPNSRHARMASANANATAAASSAGASKASLEATPASPPPALMPSAPVYSPPRLTLTTTDSQESGTIQAPSTPQRPPSAILEDTEAVYMSPDESRSSEEDRERRKIIGNGNARRNSPAGLDLASTMSMKLPPPHTKSSGEDTPIAAVKDTFPSNVEATPRPQQQNGLAGMDTGKKLPRSPSKTSLIDNSSSSMPLEGTQSRTNTSQHLLLPSDGEGGISDSASIISASGKKKKRLWKKSSTSSFLGSKSKDAAGGSALGAALAASAMGMANATGGLPRMPTVTPERLRQDTAKVSSPPKDPRQMFKMRRESESSEGLYDSDDALSLNDHDIPITGFAVASSKRNNDFHELFPDIPDDDYLIEDYGCALQKEILVQGRLYISENHMAFHANIFGWVTNFTISFTSVTGLEKRMTAFVIPNAIMISTTDSKYLFASFLSRDTVYDVISNIWRLARPRLNGNASMSDVASTFGEASTTVNGGGGVAAATGNGHSSSPPTGTTKKTGHRATQCLCSKNKQHYAETTMDFTVPGTPEKIYNLMFASGFVKEFMSDNQKLQSIQISDWAPQTDGSHLLARNMSYIKLLSGSVGPKQTKCEVRDETLHVDFDDWVSVGTTTRTPDVPSGGSFATKTKTCLTWAGPATTRIVVSAMVEWTGRSFLKSIIDKSCIDGCRTYAADFEKAVRGYINEHRTEFYPEGADALDVVEAVQENEVTAELVHSPAVDGSGDPSSASGGQSRVDVERRGLQWALDTFNSAAKLTSLSFWGLIDILGDLWEMSGGGGEGGDGGKVIWLGLVFLLVVMNFWSWSSLSQSRAREKLTRETFARMNGGAVVGGLGVGYPPVRDGGGGGGGAIGDRAVGVVGGGSEADRLTVVATEAVKIFWEGVAERQEEKWRKDLEEEVRGLKESLRRLEESLKDGSASAR